MILYLLLIYVKYPNIDNISYTYNVHWVLNEFLDSFDTCTSPSCLTPISTNAPKSTTFLTVPLSFIPSDKSSIDKTSDFKIGVSNSSRGSLFGAFKDLIISSNVGFPIFNWLAISCVSMESNVFLMFHYLNLQL